MISIWEEALDDRQPHILKKDQSCQVLVLGASLTGLFTAFFCMQRGMKVIVAEEGTLEERALEVDFFDRMNELEEWAYSIWYAMICTKYGFDCEFIRMPAYYYWFSEKPSISVAKHPVFHPIKWMRQLADHLQVYEKVKIRSLEEKRLVTGSEFISFEHVVDTRKKETKETECLVGLENVNLRQGIYLCMDGDAHFLSWKDRVVMRSSYQFLFPDAVVRNEWEVNCGRKEGIYESMDRARHFSQTIFSESEDSPKR